MICLDKGEKLPEGHGAAGGMDGEDRKENLDDMAKKASEILGMDITIE